MLGSSHDSVLGSYRDMPVSVGGGVMTIEVLSLLWPWWFGGFITHAFILFITYMTQMDSYSLPTPLYTPNEGAVWAILWPLIDTLVVARFLGKGVKELWRRR